MANLSLSDLLKKMVEMGGSDLHLTTNSAPQVRVHGHLAPLPGYHEMTPVDTKQLAYSVLTDAQKHRFEEALELDFTGNVLSRTPIEPDAPLLYRGEPLADIKRTIADLLVAAVDRRLENNPQPMALLSGGIDSTVVTQLTADRLKRLADGRRLQVITLGAMIPYTQDEYYARYAAKRLGLALDIVHPPRQRLPDAIRRALALQDEPLGMPSYFFLFQLIEAVAPYGRVLFTGDGGDDPVIAPVTPLLSGKPVTAKDKAKILNIYAMTQNKNETMRIVWGGKNAQRAAWLKEILQGEAAQ